jgi:N-acetyl-anhydromuramyl-L-alanine amidase AmpD
MLRATSQSSPTTSAADPIRRLLLSYGAMIVVTATIATVLIGCLGTTPRATSENTCIVVCGERFDIGTRVVLWTEPDGYDAYREVPHFETVAEALAADPPRDPHGKRYGERKSLPPAIAERVQRNGWTRDDLANVVDQFVVHFDVCGTSRQCFKILQDRRKLSVHFMLDVDGTIYQTLDLKERAWHATIANDRAVGVEIAHIGAYPAPGHPVMRSWYATDEHGPYVKFPGWMKELGIRTPKFIARPATAQLHTRTINGDQVWMQDFTKEQHAALARLAAGLHRALPKIRLDVPRGPDGKPTDDVLPAADFAAFQGVLGHYHVQANKNDPGPALDWDRFLTEARAVRLP